MTKIKTNVFKILLIVLGLVLTSSFFYSSSLIVNADTVGGSESENDSYYSKKPIYSRMFVNIDVQKSGIMSFTYDFDVTAVEPNKTEILIYVPYIETVYRNIDGETQKEKYYAKISNYNVVGHNGTEYVKTYVDEISNYVTLAIKSPTYYNVGELMNFKLSYDYDMHFNYQEGYDEVYINLLGGTFLDINNVSFQINLPKNVDFSEYKPYIYTGMMGTSGTFDDFAIIDISISSTTTFDVRSGYSLTYRQLLPQGYFEGREESNVLMYVIIVSTIVLALVLIFLKKKSKPDKMVVPVQLEMPNMLPTDAELYYSNKITKKSIGATIIYLANLGYVKITTVGDKCEPDKLIKVKDLPADFDPKVKRIFERVFKNDKSEVSLDDFGSLSLYERMYQYKNSKEANYNKEAYTESSRKRYNLIQVLDILFAIVPIVFFFLHMKTALGFIPNIILFIFFLLVSGGLMLGSQTIKASNVKIVLFIMSIVFSLSSCASLLGYTAFNSCIPAIFGYIILFIIGLLPVYKKYTPETIENVRVVRGVKNYIEKVEKNRIEKLVMENPTIYYDILPFAYVLGVSDKWISAFEDIVVTPPTWLMGDGDVFVSFRPYHMHSICRGINNNMNSFVNSSRAQKFASSSGGGGSSFGGGGGGFSGGGGGGASFGGMR